MTYVSLPCTEVDMAKQLVHHLLPPKTIFSLNICAIFANDFSIAQVYSQKLRQNLFPHRGALGHAKTVQPYSQRKDTWQWMEMAVSHLKPVSR